MSVKNGQKRTSANSEAYFLNRFSCPMHKHGLGFYRESWSQSKLAAVRKLTSRRDTFFVKRITNLKQRLSTVQDCTAVAFHGQINRMLNQPQFPISLMCFAQLSISTAPVPTSLSLLRRNKSHNFLISNCSKDTN